jgi:hypothetical protein
MGQKAEILARHLSPKKWQIRLHWNTCVANYRTNACTDWTSQLVVTGLGQDRILKEVVGNIYVQWDEIISDIMY